MGLENAAPVVARAPLLVNARGHCRSNERVVAIADVLDLVVVTNLLHVRPVVEVPSDPVQHNLSMFKLLRMWTVHYAHKSF